MMLSAVLKRARAPRTLVLRACFSSAGEGVDTTTRRRTSRRSTLRSRTSAGAVEAVPDAPPATAQPHHETDPWVAVTDKATGMVYYWNTVTNETTHLGAPKPGTSVAYYAPGTVPATASSGGGMMSGIGGMVAQGMAFGAGSAIAHNAIGALFGGSSSSTSPSSYVDESEGYDL